MTTQENAPLPSPPETRLDTRGIAFYLLLAFGLTWTVEIIALASGKRFDQPGVATNAMLVLVMFFPAVSAFLVRQFITREGFASAGLRFGGPRRLYIAAWLGTPILFALVYGLSALVGLGRFDWSLENTFAQFRAAAPDQPIPSPSEVLGAVFAASMSFGLLITTVATFGEEFGWTGYLLPKLLPLGRFRAAIIYGIIWGLWHAPIIYGGYNYPGYPIVGIAMMCLFTTALALVQTSLRIRSGSVILTSFFHAALNTQARGAIPLVVVGVHPLFGGIAGLLGIAVIATLGAIMLARTKED